LYRSLDDLLYYGRAELLGALFLFGVTVETSLRIAEFILAVSLVTLILMQSRGTSLGSVFGQEGSVFHTRRGAERVLFNVSIGVAVAFLIISVALARVVG
jgi:preprotein translocase subunit SecG